MSNNEYVEINNKIKQISNQIESIIHLQQQSKQENYQFANALNMLISNVNNQNSILANLVSRVSDLDINQNSLDELIQSNNEINQQILSSIEELKSSVDAIKYYSFQSINDIF